MSYAAEDDGHVDRVIQLATRLRLDGVDAVIDRYYSTPPEGWPRWMANQIEDSDYVLLVCTPVYRRRFEGKARESRDMAAARTTDWEDMLATQLLHDRAPDRARLVPIGFEHLDDEVVPLVLRPLTRFVLAQEYDSLLNHLHRAAQRSPSVGVLDAGSRQATAPNRRALAPFDVQSDGLGDDDPGPTILGCWALGELLGRGGYGAVYAARDKSGREAAVKVLDVPHRLSKSNARQRQQRFERGPAALRKLAEAGRCPHIVSLLEGPCHTSGVSWYAMERVPGPSLRRLGGNRLRAIPFLERIRWFHEICLAIRHAHSRLGGAVFHRDLTPENILLDTSGSEWHAVVCDFDFSRDETDHSISRSTGLLGKPLYVPPEQRARWSDGWDGYEADRPSEVRRDLWSLGMLLLYLASGQEREFDQETVTCSVGGSCADVAPTALERVEVLIRGLLDPQGSWPASAALVEAEVAALVALAGARPTQSHAEAHASERLAWEQTDSVPGRPDAVPSVADATVDTELANATKGSTEGESGNEPAGGPTPAQLPHAWFDLLIPDLRQYINRSVFGEVDRDEVLQTVAERILTLDFAKLQPVAPERAPHSVAESPSAVLDYWSLRRVAFRIAWSEMRSARTRWVRRVRRHVPLFTMPVGEDPSLPIRKAQVETTLFDPVVKRLCQWTGNNLGGSPRSRALNQALLDAVKLRGLSYEAAAAELSSSLVQELDEAALRSRMTQLVRNFRELGIASMLLLRERVHANLESQAEIEAILSWIRNARGLHDSLDPVVATDAFRRSVFEVEDYSRIAEMVASSTGRGPDENNLRKTVLSLLRGCRLAYPDFPEPWSLDQTRTRGPIPR